MTNSVVLASGAKPGYSAVRNIKRIDQTMVANISTM
jgi:hypothetical protein